LTFADIAFTTAALLAVAMLAMWLLSLTLHNVAVADIFWPLGFVLVAALSARADGYGSRKALIGVLVAVWSVRLATHLYLRNRGHGEDPRYRAMRRRWGARFPVVSLFTVFVFQGALLWIVSLPLQVAMTSREPRDFTALDGLGVALWVCGFAFESVGDFQLTRFKSDPAHAGKVMDRGLWRYTRHPNYFGDATAWWGIGLIALSTHRWWAVVGPLVMTVLLMRVSGVPLLERRMKRTRSDYEEYAARTSAFVPMPPKEKR
jgi:steroid 5-alpha reductase family enzyme